MAKYLVTGGCGFIGSQLTQKLLELGHEVIVVDDLSNGTIINPLALFIKQDITCPDMISKLFLGLDGCFHLAAIPCVNMNLDQWDRFHAVNLNGSLNVFKAAIKASNIPVVYASSCAVYGNAKRYPLTERLMLRPPSAYGCDKLATELNASFLADSYQLSSVGLRLFNVYGPYQRDASPYSGVITHFITSALEGKPFTIFGDGEQTRDFVFVGDVVENFIHAMSRLTNMKQQAQVVNICSGNPVTMNQLASLISELLGKKCLKNYEAPRKSDAKESYGSPKKMQELGFKLEHDLKQGLIKTIAYFKTL